MSTVEIYNYRLKYSNLNTIQKELQLLEKRKQHFSIQYEQGVIEKELYIKVGKFEKSTYKYDMFKKYN